MHKQYIQLVDHAEVQPSQHHLASSEESTTRGQQRTGKGKERNTRHTVVWKTCEANGRSVSIRHTVMMD